MKSSKKQLRAWDTLWLMKMLADLDCDVFKLNFKEAAALVSPESDSDSESESVLKVQRSFAEKTKYGHTLISEPSEPY